jgi:hypothetical protein
MAPQNASTGRTPSCLPSPHAKDLKGAGRLISARIGMNANKALLHIGWFRCTISGIKLLMIRLGNKYVEEEVVLRPGSRYAIFEVTNGTMTAPRRDIQSITKRGRGFLIHSLGVNLFVKDGHCGE